MTRRALPRQSIFFGELTWQEAEKRLNEIDIALLPVGAIEQHGPHLPLDTDAFDADYLALTCSDGMQTALQYRLFYPYSLRGVIPS